MTHGVDLYTPKKIEVLRDPPEEGSVNQSDTVSVKTANIPTTVAIPSLDAKLVAGCEGDNPFILVEAYWLSHPSDRNFSGGERTKRSRSNCLLSLSFSF